MKRETTVEATWDRVLDINLKGTYLSIKAVIDTMVAQRSGSIVTIASVEQTPDTTMLLLSNMDQRALHEIRRGISLWRYRRWQERGFR